MPPLETLLRNMRALLRPSVSPAIPAPHFAVLAVLAALLLGGCLSGTETGTENTVVQDGELEGKALLLSGRPAALASVMVRTGEVEVSANGVPSWKLWSKATADSQGRFKVQIPKDRNLFLEIRESLPVSADSVHSSPYPQVYFSRFAGGDSLPGDGLDYGLQPSGSLQGRLDLGSGSPAQGYWVGILGSSSLVPLDSAMDGGGHPFHLEGVHSGQSGLILMHVGGQVGTASLKSFGETVQAEVKPETNTDLGTIFYNDSTNAPVLH